VAAGAHECNAEGNKTVAETRGFAGGKDEADVGKHDAKGANELDELSVCHVSERLKFTGARAESRNGDGELSFPASAKEIIGVGGDAEGLESPIAEAVESANAETAEAGVVGAFGGFETPIEIALGTGGVHVDIDSAVVSFLIDDEAFGARFDDGAIFGGFHGPDFEGDAWDFVVEGADAVGQVVGGNELRMFAGNKEDVAEAVGEELAGFFEDFLDGKRDSQNGVISGKAAIFAIVDAFVGEIEGGEETDDFAEALLAELLRAK
jgi:hypothetical protein